MARPKLFKKVSGYNKLFWIHCKMNKQFDQFISHLGETNHWLASRIQRTQITRNFAMIYTLTNDSFTASISDEGAELTSFKDLNSGTEHMWKADPEIWGSSAPVLFPIVGMLKDGKFLHEGNVFELGKHGLARSRTFSVVEQTNDRIRFRLTSDAETLAIYPFPFELEVSFILSPKCLRCDYTVRNPGEQEMIFGLGSHPAFALDLSDSPLEDYYIEFESPEILDLYLLDGSLISENPTKEFLKNEQQLPLSETVFDQDALIFKNIRSQKISIKHRQKGRLLSLDRGPCPHLGIWAKPKAPYVCIEPWHTYADTTSHNQKWNEKRPNLRLGAGQTFKSHYEIELA